MNFSLINSLANFQKMMDELLKYFSFARSYLDNLILHLDSIEDYLEHLQVVLRIFQK